jgi:hypothetical protein
MLAARGRGWDRRDPLFDHYVVPDDPLETVSDSVVLRGLLRPVNVLGFAHILKVVSRGIEVELKGLRRIQEDPHEHIIQLLREFPPHGPRAEHVLAFEEADMDLRQFLMKSGSGR